MESKLQILNAVKVVGITILTIGISHLPVRIFCKRLQCNYRYWIWYSNGGNFYLPYGGILRCNGRDARKSES